MPDKTDDEQVPDLKGRVSVVMPARNAASTIAEALQSVLVQAEVREVIVVDDKSHDRTRAVVESLQDPRVIILEGEGRGVARSLNRAIDHATGQFVARCDSDDRFAQDRLAWQVAWMDRHTDYVAVSSGFQTMSKDGRVIARLACDGAPRDVTDQLLEGAAVTTLCSFLIRREALLQAGGARDWFVTSEDLDLMFRLASRGPVWHNPDVGYYYRLHDSSTVHTQPDVQRRFFEATAVTFALERRDGYTDSLDRGSPPVIPNALSIITTAGSQIAGQLEGRAWSAFRLGHRREALGLIIRALQNAPTRSSSWRSLILLLARRPRLENVADDM